MKMIYVGSLATKPDRDSLWVKEFKRLNWQVIQFSSYCKVDTNGIIGKIKARFHLGYENREMQNSLISLVKKEKPSWVHFRLPIDFDKTTIKLIKQHTQVVTEYFNDDPFSKKSPFGIHWKFLKALSFYDAHFVYRSRNISEFIKAGAKYVKHCPPAYDPERHFIGERKSSKEFIADAAFIGHCENDKRVKYLEALHNLGYKIIIKGGMWEKYIKNSSLKVLSPIKHAFGSEYNNIYSNTNAGLCFFSKINNDTWTERPLEIIAVGGLLVCERTMEAENYFRDREEAFFFSSINELKKIIDELKEKPIYREKVCAEGYKRLIENKHTIHNRALDIDHFVRDHLNHPL